MIFSTIPQIFFYKPKSENELLLDDNYVTVYKSKKVYYYQELDSSKNIDELKYSIEKSLNLDSLNLVQSNEIKLNKKSNYEFFKPIKSNVFKFFLVYMAFICFGFYFFEFEKNDKKNELLEIQNNTIALKANMTFEAISDDIASLYKKAKAYGLSLLSLNFRNSKFIFTLKSKEKQNIYEFLKELNGSVESMSYDEETKEYLANASFKTYRR